MSHHIVSMDSFYGQTGLHTHCACQSVCEKDQRSHSQNGDVDGTLGPVYTKCQHQGCDHSAMTLVILFSLKSMETLENGLQTHSGASSQSGRSIDVDAWCKTGPKQA